MLNNLVMTSLHYLDPNPSGNPTVLLLHGLGADGTSWSLQLPALSQAGFRPLAPDAPGFGGSPYDGGGWNIRRVAGQMAGLLEELGSGPAHVVGLSMGGVIAQQFALDFPQLTKKLVLVSTFSVLRPQDLSGWAYFLRRAASFLVQGPVAQAQVVARRVFPDPKDQPLREMYLAIVAHADPRAYRQAMAALGLFDSSKRLREISVPTLVVTGADDSTVSPARQKFLADGIPGARQVIIPNGGHAVSVDQSQQFNRALLEFLQE
ncbi:MAG: alpha/beta fold hydrolase [Anaerolineales bacterium]